MTIVHTRFPNLDAPAQRAEDDTRSSLLSKISPPGVISVLRRGAAAGSTGSVDPGNKNKTHSQTVAEFFREHKWVRKGMNSVTCNSLIRIKLVILCLTPHF